MPLIGIKMNMEFVRSQLQGILDGLPLDHTSETAEKIACLHYAYTAELAEPDVPHAGDDTVIPAEAFVDDPGMLPSDGCGYWATETHFSWSADCFGYRPSWATHVNWSND